MTEREKIVEVMARGNYTFATDGMDWDAATDITKSKMIEFAQAALTALEASGMAVVPVSALKKKLKERRDSWWNDREKNGRRQRGAGFL